MSWITFVTGFFLFCGLRFGVCYELLVEPLAAPRRAFNFVVKTFKHRPKSTEQVKDSTLYIHGRAMLSILNAGHSCS